MGGDTISRSPTEEWVSRWQRTKFRNRGTHQMAYRGFSNGRVVLCFQQTWCWVPFSSQTLLASRCSRAWPVQYSCGPTPRSRTLQLPLHLWAQRSAPGPRADGAGLPPAVANWFPGHIAKAMRELRDRLSLIDVVVEVVDARIPYTTYPLFIHELIGNKSRVLALNRIDMVPSVAGRTWLRALRRGALDTGCSVTAPEGTCVWPCVATDGKIGTGIPQLRRACIAAGTTVNERRAQRGLLPRPVRVVVIGFPNVGKSALINRLCGRRAAVSAARPGVTRQLQWVRLTQDLELLDTPGIIPPKLEDQEASSRLAMCDDIGETAYDVERIASMLVDSLLALEGSRWIEHSTVAIEEQHSARAILEKRYGCSGFSNGEEFLHLAAEKCTQKNVEKMSRRLLTDFRQLSLGRICLEPLVDRIESNTDSTALRH